MLRFLLRAVGAVLVAVSFAILVADGTRTIAAGEISMAHLGETAAGLLPKQFPLLKPAVERNISPLLWDPVLVNVLRLPTWLSAALAGLAIIFATRQRATRIGYTYRP
jgi:hypothetical protein